ncbi:hypothetical protein SLA2020_429920 [Shorea laevis]
MLPSSAAPIISSSLGQHAGPVLVQPWNGVACWRPWGVQPDLQVPSNFMRQLLSTKARRNCSNTKEPVLVFSQEIENTSLQIGLHN